MAPHALADDVDRSDGESHALPTSTAVPAPAPAPANGDSQPAPSAQPPTDAQAAQPSTNPYDPANGTDSFTNGYKAGYTVRHIELKNKPIAIIGMACRMPGSVSTPDEFWELLARSRTGYSEIPEARFSAKRWFHPNPGKSGALNARGGNFLTHDLTVFDAPFFGMTREEAVTLDPQQRLLLECAFEAFESAGIPKHTLVGSDVGVFTGGTPSEYEAEMFRDPEAMRMHQATGNAMAMQSNRISYFFDLKGPSFTVDTACSSSMVALHSACQSIRCGESSMALVGGVHLNMLPEFWVSFSMSRLFGEDGRSYSFDERGTGYGRGEGAGMILLKPLDEAMRDNDPIRAVITGSGVNQDGKTPGITMPSASAQEKLMRTVYANAGMNPLDVGYVEAHGTGTAVGDPIEVSAIQKVFGEGRTKRKPLYMGSVKSNIGHLEAAAGIASVIKTALMLERGFILPNYDFQKPNKKIPLADWNLKVPIRQQPWPLDKHWASVAGFGFGGTNAHCVLGRAPLARKAMKQDIDLGSYERLFIVSATDKVSAEKTMTNLAVYLEQRPEVFQNDLVGNVAYTLGQRRSVHSWRVAIAANSSRELVEGLTNGTYVPVKEEAEGLRQGWIFTGQGAQWWAMGRELYERYPVYASALDKADAHLRSLGAHFSLLEELQKDETTTQVNAAHISQPACTAVQLALTDLLKSWGIQPKAVAGHSSGEIGAAYAAGIINFEDAMTIGYHRGRLIPILKKTHPELDGGMLAVGAGKAQILPLLERIPTTKGHARIACVNSPSSVTVSGDVAAIVELEALINEEHAGMFVRKLQVDTAYHSHHMNLVSKQYTESLLDIQPPQLSEVRFHSSLLGRVASGTELDASYWIQNLVCPVLFDDAVQTMVRPTGTSKTGVDFLVELGPHAALQGPIKQILKEVGGAAPKIAYNSALSRKKDAVKTTLSLVGSLFVKGLLPDMGAVNFVKNAPRPAVLTDMPRYAWNHSSKFIHETRFGQIQKHHNVARNDIIGLLAPYSNDFEPTWRLVVRLDDLPWLRHHQMQGVTIFPIAGFASMAIEAMAQNARGRDIAFDALEVRDLNVTSPAMLTEDELELTVSIKFGGKDAKPELSYPFTIRSWEKNKGWTEHCTGSVATVSTNSNAVDGLRTQQAKQDKLQALVADITQSSSELVDSKALYERLSDIGVAYGPSFQGLHNCHASDIGATARIVTVDTKSDMPHQHETDYIVHPVLLEQLVSLYWPVFSATTKSLQTVHLPSAIGKITVHASLVDHLQGAGSGLQAYCKASSPLSDVTKNALSMFAVSKTGDALLSIEDVSTSPIRDGSDDSATEAARELCFKTEWETALPYKATDVNSSLQHSFNEDIVIVHGETELQHKLTASISDGLFASTGKRPSAATLAEASTTTAEKLCIFIAELDAAVMAGMKEETFLQLKRFLTDAGAVLWVSHGAYYNSINPDSNMIIGLSRTLRGEGVLLKFITLDLASERDLLEPNTTSTILHVLHETLGANANMQEAEFVERDGQLMTPRVANDYELNTFVDEQINPPKAALATFSDVKRPLHGVIRMPGHPDTLSFSDDDRVAGTLSDNEVDILVKATGISSRDLEVTTNVGLECSGVVVAVGPNTPRVKVGDRVAALTLDGSLSTVVRVHYKSLIKIPDHVSFEAAATIPSAYSTAVLALLEQARLVEDETVLIHDAASATGQAALSVAQMIGTEVWTTVNSVEEKTLLQETFHVPEDRIYFSGNDTFAEGIKEATEGRGVDVVFHNLTESHLLRATLAAVATFGRVVSVSTENTSLPAVPLAKNLSLSNVDLIALATHRPSAVQRTLLDVDRLLKYGKIQPLVNVKSYGISETIAALQDVQSQVHAKVTIVAGADDTVMAPRVAAEAPVFRNDATYILIGGTGGLGREMTKWMVSKGAHHIVLLSRSGTLTGQGKVEIDALKDAGANVVIRSCNVADRADVDRLITTGLSDLPPVRGIIHGAMVLRDVLFEKMTHELYNAVTESKVAGAWNFYHSLTANKTDLDFFIVISSVAGAAGTRGQGAYASANTFLNGFAQHLRSKGIRSASLDLTAVSDVGFLAEHSDRAAEAARNLGGADTISGDEVLALVQAAVQGKLDSCNGHPMTGLRITATMRPFWSTDPKFLPLLRVAEAASATGTSSVTVSWSTAFKTAPSKADAEKVVCNGLVAKMAEVMSMEPSELDTARSLSHYPLDSLTAIEVRNFITRNFESSLQVLELLATGSIEGLAKVVMSKTKVKLPEA